MRGRIWYLCYHENGQPRRPRVGPDAGAARRLAAQTNAQLESGDIAVLSFEPVAIPDLRQHWLDHHEHVLQSSVNTINRYRTATDHLLNFVRDVRPVRVASNLITRDAEAFVQYLRTIEVAPHGHANSKKRRLLDKGVCSIVECCRTLLMYDAKRRHLSAYAEKPFTAIGAGSIPVEDAKPIVLFTSTERRSRPVNMEPREQTSQGSRILGQFWQGVTRATSLQRVPPWWRQGTGRRQSRAFISLLCALCMPCGHFPSLPGTDRRVQTN